MYNGSKIPKNGSNGPKMGKFSISLLLLKNIDETRPLSRPFGLTI
jgi:hypothetical protein